MYSNVEKDLKEALNLYDESKDRFAKYSKMYLLTTENLDGYYKYFNFKNKIVLTVTSSYDHALNAILLGAKEVVTFDINKLAIYISNLKLAAVKTIKYQEFIDFFLGDKGFDYQVFKKISAKLDDQTKYFFEKIYNNFGYQGQSIKESFLFHHGHLNKIEDNTYLLNENNYYKLKEKVANDQIIFINCSLLELPKIIKNRKFDLILLSNISDYANKFFGKEYLKEYFDFIKKDIIKLLKEKGTIAAAYFYGYDDEEDARSDINIKEKRDKVIKNDFKTIIFKSTILKFKKDGIIVHQRR